MDQWEYILWIKKHFLLNTELSFTKSETKQDCSFSDPGIDIHEMESIVVTKVGTTAKGNEILSEQPTSDAKQVPAKEEEVVAVENDISKVDLSKQEETATGTTVEQRQEDVCSADIHPNGSQSSQDDKNHTHSSGGNRSQT